MTAIAEESSRLLKAAQRSLPEPTWTADQLFPRSPVNAGPTVVFHKNETIRIVTSEGRSLLEITQDDAGPVIRLARPDIVLDVPGKLDIAAAEISLRASGDVVVGGRTIRLN